MDMRTLLRTMTEPEREDFARRADSSLGYLRLIAGGHRRPSTALAKRLVDADGRLSLHELRPDVWDVPTADAGPTSAKPAG